MSPKFLHHTSSASYLRLDRHWRIKIAEFKFEEIQNTTIK